MERKENCIYSLPHKCSNLEETETCESKRWVTYKGIPETAKLSALFDQKCLPGNALPEYKSMRKSGIGTGTNALYAQHGARMHEPDKNTGVPKELMQQPGELRYEAGEQHLQTRRSDRKELSQLPERPSGLQLTLHQHGAQAEKCIFQNSWKTNSVGFVFESTAETEAEEDRTTIQGEDSSGTLPSANAFSLHNASSFEETYSPERRSVDSFSPECLSVTKVEIEEQTRRDVFRTYWECALQKFGVSEDGMLLKPGAKELGFSDADGEEVLRIITETGLTDDTGKTVIPTWTRQQGDLEALTSANEEPFERPPTCVLQKAGADAFLKNGTHSCLLQSLHLGTAVLKAESPGAELGTTRTKTSPGIPPKCHQKKDPKSAGDADASIEAGFLEGKARSLNIGGEVAKTLLAANISRGSTKEGVTRTAPLTTQEGLNAEQKTERGGAEKQNNPFKRVLELGAGIGRLTKLLQTVADEVVAVDFIKEYVEENRKANGNSMERARDRFVVADATKLEFPLRPSPTQIVFLPDGQQEHQQSAVTSSSEDACYLSFFRKQRTDLLPSTSFALEFGIPSASRADLQLKSRSADLSHEKFDLLVINWLLMYLSVEEVRRLLRNLIASWSTTNALIFVRESCGEPSDKGQSSREWAKSGNPTVYRSHQVYTSLIEEEARYAGVEIEFVAKSRPMQVYWKKSGTDSQRYWVLRVKS